LKHIETPIKRHTKVKGDKSPFDGDWTYWNKRGINKVGLPTKLARLLKKQKGKCNECGLFFMDSDLIEVDHIKPLAVEGKDIQKTAKHCIATATTAKPQETSSQLGNIRRKSAPMTRDKLARSRMR